MTAPYLKQITIKLKTQYKRCREYFKNTEFPISILKMALARYDADHPAPECSHTGNFFEMSSAQYVDKYTVPVGEKYTQYEFVEVTDEVIETLDFITNKHWLAPEEETDSNKQFSYSRTCKRSKN